MPCSLAISCTRFLAIHNRFYEVITGPHRAPERTTERAAAQGLLRAVSVAHIRAAARPGLGRVGDDVLAVEGQASQLGLRAGGSAPDAATHRDVWGRWRRGLPDGY